MGLFLPLVVYTATRKRYGDWQDSPYNKAKTNFLCQKREQLLPFYEFVFQNSDNTVTFGMKPYTEKTELFESDLVNRPVLSSKSIGNNCTILITSFYDILRGRTDIRKENEGLSDDEVDERLAAEIASVEAFLAGLTPFLFVPGFSFSPYIERPTADSERLAKSFNELMEPIVVERIYESYDEDLLAQTAADLMDLQGRSRSYLQNKLEKTKEAMEKAKVV
ncbi:hypothetical protein DSM110093_04237 (plasmid) [Sulfitobacter sp. DSM 110093]|uniref:hypothetical protein n=1 Tax=Sulfitobacter sp. DSM 110093 TaxID=2883127 RepID=UPI001FADABAD|nr:hypothetical protein [Sulfitobacter sp. DSM 110093]UOA34401.1 hypothetical protein DSM110093_04237 [Sulfitobacter sp. DSM 110093]